MYLYERLNLERKRKQRQNEIKHHLHELEPVDTYAGDGKYISMMTSMSHTYGNVIAFMQKWILELFPKDLFKTVHVNSQLSHRQLRYSNHEFIKKKKPAIIFRPRIAGPDEDYWLKGTELMHISNSNIRTWGDGSLFDFIDDANHDLTIKYHMNRAIIYLDVTVIFQTLLNQIDYFNAFLESVAINEVLGVETFLESYIPPEMLYIISQIAEVPMFNEKDGNTKEFLDYLNGISYYPITYKLRGSTRQREFFRYYPACINVTITDVDRDDGEEQGMTQSNFKFTFTVKCEFNTTGFYYLFNKKIHDLKLPEHKVDDSSYIPMYTDVLLNDDLRLKEGWQIYNQATIQFEREDERVNIRELLNTSIVAAIQYYRENGLPTFDIIDVKCRRQGELMYEGHDYQIDWDTFDIHFRDTDVYHTYRIWICLNLEAINELIKTIYNLQ